MIDPRQVADALVAAEREGKPIAPFTDTYPFLDAGRAYQVQRLFVEDHLTGADQVIGAKLGMTSRVKRAMLGVDQPVSGWLTAGMVLPYGQPVPLEQLIHPQAEPEIAIVLGTEPAHPATVASVLSATEAVFAAIEVIDSRFEDFRYRLPDVIADNVCAAKVAFGTRMHGRGARRPAAYRLCFPVARRGGRHRGRCRRDGTSGGCGCLARQHPGRAE